jgi:hypothetical protein
LEAAILAATDGRQPNARWAGQSCARAFTEKLRILTQHLTTPTDDPLPRFFRLADADPYLRHYLLGRQRPGTRIETLSWYWRFLMMIILVRQLSAAVYDLSTVQSTN